MRCLATVLAAALATAAHADVFMFATPSGNIHCSVGLSADAADVECTIVERQGPPAAPQPVTCGASWGHTFLLFDTGPVQMVCTPPPRRLNIGEIAPYGQSGQFNLITCQSERTGLTCRNASGHGFFLSRRQQLIF